MSKSDLASSPALMDEVVRGQRTKSDKIRALSKAGFSRAQIADYLGIRYQHVRNVLVHDEKVAARTVTAPSVAGEVQDGAMGDPLYPMKVKIEGDGRVRLPPALLQAAGIKENESAVISIEGDTIQLMSLSASVRRAQDAVRRFVPRDVSLVDELIAERRDEVRRENGDA